MTSTAPGGLDAKTQIPGELLDNGYNWGKKKNGEMEDNCLAVAPSACVHGVYESSQHGFAAGFYP